MFDLFQSRRTYNERCLWWSVKDDKEPEEIITNRTPSGSFYAKESESQRFQTAEDNVIYMFDKTTVTIKTPDNVDGIKNNDIVSYQGEKWIIVSVQSRLARNQNTYFASNRNSSHYTYIELRK